MSEITHRFDYVIVGGGSAGCVLANRLSVDPRVHVALIEAGVDTRPGATPTQILDSYPMPVFCGDTWIWPELKARAMPQRPARVYEQGRVMGGGSSINVQSANRGLPRDYDRWAAMGAAGWSWNEVLPYFRKMERDLTYPNDPLHGASGPLPIRRIARKDWPAFCESLFQGMQREGLEVLRDQNTQFDDGCFPSAFSNENDQRVSAAAAYLDTATRQRKNLCIYSQIRVTDLHFEGLRATGVRGHDVQNGEPLEITARAEVILSAGALQSPPMLLRAGIGDPTALAALGIACRVARPAVGQHLQDHPSMTFCHYLSPEWRTPLSYRRASMTAARTTSGVVNGEESDLYFSSATRAAWHRLGTRLGLFFLWCNQPLSRGALRLASADPLAAPIVDLNLLAEPRDMACMKAAVHQLAAFVHASDFHKDPRDFFPASFSPGVKALSRVTPMNSMITSMLGAALDLAGSMRHRLIARFLTGGVTVDGLLRDETELEDFIRGNVFGVWHASGTCRMGAEDDMQAVVDPQGRVHGTQALRVIDASVMPCLPSANTNIPTIMIAEKMADSILASR